MLYRLFTHWLCRLFRLDSSSCLASALFEGLSDSGTGVGPGQASTSLHTNNQSNLSRGVLRYALGRAEGRSGAGGAVGGEELGDLEVSRSDARSRCRVLRSLA